MSSQVTFLRPDRGGAALDLAELWRYRSLLYMFAMRDLKTCRKQTVLGPVWPLLPTLVTTGLFTVLFGVLLGRGNEPTVAGVPYALSTLCAMVPWRLFASCVSGTSQSLISNQALLAKIYCPRLVFPLAALAVPLLDAAIAFLLLVAAMLYSGFMPGWGLLLLPAFVLFSLTSALAIGLWAAPLGAIYRDIAMGAVYLVQLGMYLSPVIYATGRIEQSLPPWAVGLYWLNPMVGIIEGFRFALFGATDFSLMALLPSLLLVVILLVSGLYFFRRMERIIVDVI